MSGYSKLKRRSVRWGKTISPAYFNVLGKIHKRLNKANVNWVVTGSLSFALQGVPVKPNDIDVQTDETGAYEIERRFSEFVTKRVTFSSTKRIRSHFGELRIDGVKVEIMGGVQKRLENGSWEAPVKLKRHKLVIEVEEMQIPVLSLEYEYQAYLMLGRTKKANMLRQWLNDKKM
jgi:hypothetical protein